VGEGGHCAQYLRGGAGGTVGEEGRNVARGHQGAGHRRSHRWNCLVAHVDRYAGSAPMGGGGGSSPFTHGVFLFSQITTHFILSKGSPWIGGVVEGRGEK
jgi:hypothetical protein